MAIDWDSIFTYSTVKIVRIRDKRLGILHISFMACILFYIVIYTTILKKGYLFEEIPIGSIRTSLLAPSTYATNLTYCQNQPHEGVYQWNQLNCEYWDDSLVVFPVGEASTFSATTRVKALKQTATCDFSSPDCQYVEDKNYTKNIFLADIEDFTILIDHTMYAPSSQIQYNAIELHGAILNQDGDEVQVNEGINSIGVKGKNDIITLGKLLEFGGINLDSPSPVDGNNSIRYDGVVLFVFITYSNTYTYSTSEFEYVYSVRPIADTIYDSPETIILSDINNRLIYKRHGIRLIFIQTGTIGSFRFQTLLLTLVSGLGLLAISTTVVDQLAVRILPQRKSYSSMKFETTKNFSSNLKKIVTDEGEEVLYSKIESL